MTSMDADAADPVVLEYPFRGRWLARNSPARRIPSHGTHLFGVTYAIDFIGVDEHGRSGPVTWRTAPRRPRRRQRRPQPLLQGNSLRKRPGTLCGLTDVRLPRPRVRGFMAATRSPSVPNSELLLDDM